MISSTTFRSQLHEISNDPSSTSRDYHDFCRQLIDALDMRERECKRLDERVNRYREELREAWISAQRQVNSIERAWRECHRMESAEADD